MASQIVNLSYLHRFDIDLLPVAADRYRIDENLTFFAIGVDQ